MMYFRNWADVTLLIVDIIAYMHFANLLRAIGCKNHRVWRDASSAWSNHLALCPHVVHVRLHDEEVVDEPLCHDDARLVCEPVAVLLYHVVACPARFDLMPDPLLVWRLVGMYDVHALWLVPNPHFLWHRVAACVYLRNHAPVHPVLAEPHEEAERLHVARVKVVGDFVHLVVSLVTQFLHACLGDVVGNGEAATLVLLIPDVGCHVILRKDVCVRVARVDERYLVFASFRYFQGVRELALDPAILTAVWAERLDHLVV